MRRMRALVAGLALAITLVYPVAAATTADVTDTFSVNSTLSLVLNKSAINYGAIDPGSATAAPLADRQVGVTINGNADWTLTISGTDFARTGGGSLPASVRQVKFPGSAGDWLALPVQHTGAANVPFTANAEFAVTVPANAKAGSYSGTITFTVTGS